VISLLFGFLATRCLEDGEPTAVESLDLRNVQLFDISFETAMDLNSRFLLSLIKQARHSQLDNYGLAHFLLSYSRGRCFFPE
jgi:hypothetical protein